MSLKEGDGEGVQDSSESVGARTKSLTDGCSGNSTGKVK